MSIDARDEVERRLPTVADARAFCLKYHPSFLDWLERECGWVDELHTPPAQAPVMLDLLLICFARMALRNGSQSRQPLHYHNENHILEILHRLHRVLTCCREQAASWYELALFAAAHDLRQREPVQAAQQQGCGSNEAASWAELDRLMEDLGVDLPADSRQVLRWMIEGSTFYMGMRLGTCQGAWAADMVRQMNMTASQRERVLLAADLDTANVAEGFHELAVSSLALARERLLLKPAENPRQALDFMRRFLEEVQWHYMAECQNFRSSAGIQAFEQRKQENLRHLRDFIDRLVAHEPFANQAELEYWYLNEARSKAQELGQLSP